MMTLTSILPTFGALTFSAMFSTLAAKVFALSTLMRKCRCRSGSNGVASIYVRAHRWLDRCLRFALRDHAQGHPVQRRHEGKREPSEVVQRQRNERSTDEKRGHRC